MQLNYKLSIACATMLIGTNILAQDYVRVNLMTYNENDNRVDILAPSFEVNKDIGVDYTVNVKALIDSVSGATPIYSDTSSGASAYKRGDVANLSNIKKQNVSFTESRRLISANVIYRLKNRDELSTSLSNSYESDYSSTTLGLDYLHWANTSKNLSYNLGLSLSKDDILIKNCSYNNECGFSDSISGASQKKSSNTYTIQGGFTQILNTTSLFKSDIFYTKQDGYLSNPYYNVVRNTNQVRAEQRPNLRTSYGFNIKYIKAFNDNLTSKFKYKFYSDDWDINSHTFDINNYYTLNDKITLGFGFRYYMQSKANFYNSSTSYFTNEKYASHDDRLSAFNSNTIKSSITYNINKSFTYDISLNYYKQSTGLNASYITSGLKYKF